nr:MAG TPA: hypothetical protein [Caudoviricetes sp.]
MLHCRKTKLLVFCEIFLANFIQAFPNFIGSCARCTKFV